MNVENGKFDSPGKRWIEQTMEAQAEKTKATMETLIAMQGGKGSIHQLILKNRSDMPGRFLRRMTRWALLECGGTEAGEWPLNFKADVRAYYVQHFSGPFTSEHKNMNMGCRFDSILYIRSPAHNGATYLAPGSPRRSDSPEMPGQLTIWLAPASEAENLKERVFSILAILGAAFEPFGGPKIPPGDLGMFRQPMLLKFMENADTLLAQWEEEGNVKRRERRRAHRKARRISELKEMDKFDLQERKTQ